MKLKNFILFKFQVGHHAGEMPVEQMDVNSSGELVASIGESILGKKLFLRFC
jgi:hypothetical protein